MQIINLPIIARVITDLTKTVMDQDGRLLDFRGDEIRIPIQQQDSYTLPCERFVYVEGKLKINKPNDALTVMLGNNCVAFLFDDIQYELNCVEIDRNTYVGIASTLKNYVSLTPGGDKIMEIAG